MLPYPQRFLKLNVKFQENKVLEDFKKPRTNIRIAVIQNVTVTDECVDVMPRKLPQKLEDLVSLLFYVQ